MRYVILEPLRGIAALWVFLFHYEFSDAFKTTFSVLHKIFKSGHLGVSMFFVISGFCIAASALNNQRQMKPVSSYLYRRFQRIYPTFWFSIIVVACIPFLIEAISSLKTGKYVIPSPAFITYNFCDWIRLGTLTQVFSYVPGAEDLQEKFTSFNAVYWTLAIEVQFYLAVALAIFTRKVYTFILLLAFVSIPFAFLPASFNTGLFLPFWPQFSLGVFLYWTFDNGWIPTRTLSPVYLPMVRCCAIAVGIFAFYWVAVDYPLTDLAFATWFAIFLYLSESFENFQKQSIVGSRTIGLHGLRKILMTLGAMSYSLYLLHSKLQYLAIQLTRQVFSANSIFFDFFVIVLTSLLCYVFYLLVEKRFTIGMPTGRSSR